MITTMDRHYQQSETEEVAEALLGILAAGSTEATVVGLSGDLGAGKTTLVQALAQGLGVQETVVSPTFVIAKFYDTTHDTWKKLIHIDAYRIEDPKELEVLGWKDMLSDPNTLLIVEWPERIKDILPETAQCFEIEHGEGGRRIRKK